MVTLVATIRQLTAQRRFVADAARAAEERQQLSEAAVARTAAQLEAARRNLDGAIRFSVHTVTRLRETDLSPVLDTISKQRERFASESFQAVLARFLEESRGETIERDLTRHLSTKGRCRFRSREIRTTDHRVARLLSLVFRSLFLGYGISLKVLNDLAIFREGPERPQPPPLTPLSRTPNLLPNAPNLAA